MPTPQDTRAQLRTDAINRADANAAGGASHWDTTPGTGEVDRILGSVHMQEWRRVLNASPWFQTQQYTPTTDVNGNVPLTALSQGSGDNQQNLYRIIAVSSGLQGSNGLFYSEVKSQEVPGYIMNTQQNIQATVWFRNGPNIVLPGNLGVQLTVWTNWTPTRFDQLAGDGSLVGLPDDYGEIFALEGGAALLMKGGTETDGATALLAAAEKKRQDRLQDISRIGIAPWTVSAGDSRWDWGSL